MALAVNGLGCAKEVFKRIKSNSEIDGDDNKAIFDAIKSIFDRQKPKPMFIDKLDLKEELKINGTYKKLDKELFNRIISTVPDRKSIHSTVDYVSRRSLKKEMDGKLERLSNSESGSVEKIAIEIAELAKRKSSNSADVLLSIDDYYGEIDHIEEMPECVSTGFPTLDKRLGGGYVKGNYHVICAATGAGKSIMTITSWLSQVRNGVKTVYLNYEIPRSLFMKYLFAQVTGLNVMHSGSIERDLLEYKKEMFRNEIDRYFDEGLLMLSDPMHGSSKMWNDVEVILRDIIEQSNPECIFFDTINSVYAKTSSSSQGARWNEYEYIAISAEHLTTETNVAMVFTAQPSQEAMKREDRTPQLYDVAGGKTITEKAASVIHLHRTDLYDPNRRIDYSELHITKNRVMGQEMGSLPIRVKYNKDYKNLYELEQGVQGLPLEEFSSDLPSHPIYSLSGEL